MLTTAAREWLRRVERPMPRLKMRLGIKGKLIAAMLAISVMPTLALGIAWQQSFQQGFLEYLNGRGVDRLESLVPKLAAGYRAHGTLAYVARPPTEWFELVGLPGIAKDLPIDASPAPESARNIDTTGIGLRIALLDEHRRVLIGYPDISPTAVFRPIVVDGRTVGWLALAPFDHATSAMDVRFQHTMQITVWTIGLVVVIVAALGAARLANAFLAPIHRIGAATRLLTNGDYSARLPRRSPGDEIDELAADVNSLAHSLQRADQVRRSLMADISHELRTPLAILRGELEAIVEHIRTPSDSTVSSLLAEVKTLTKLVDDIYCLSRSDIGALSYRRERLDLRPVLITCLTAFRERLNARKLQVTLRVAEDPLPVLADEARLQQLFNNLLENCVRHTVLGAQVCVTARCGEGEIVVRVEDSGPGVTDGQLSRLFERFYRTDESRNRNSGGTGLGLAICRNIVEAHGGRIDAFHSALGGVLMEFRLPALAT